MTDALVLSCEHGGNRVPARYAALFAGQAALLAGHRGWDIGALDAARRIRRALAAPLVAATVSRLVVDLNRSPRHPRRFSEITRKLPAAEQARIDARYYRPYRDVVEARVAAWAAEGRRVVHVSVHSFAAELDGRARRCDVGLLYDPARPRERNLCAAWRQALVEAAPALVVRRNYPYRGVSDGLVTALRGRFADAHYAGVELEFNQGLVGTPGWPAVVAAVAAALVVGLDLSGSAAAGRPGRDRRRSAGTRR